MQLRSQKFLFWLAIIASAVVLVSWWWMDTQRRLAQLGGGRALEGLPVEKSKRAYEELRDVTASSLEGLREQIRELVESLPTATSVEDISTSSSVTPSPGAG